MKSQAKKVTRKPTTRKIMYSALGGLLTMRRTTLGLTQRQVARKLGLNDASNINGYETGRLAPKEKLLRSLATVYEINPHQVYTVWELDKYRREQRAHWDALNKRQGLV